MGGVLRRMELAELTTFPGQIGFLRSFLMGIFYTSADPKPYSNIPLPSTCAYRMWQTASLTGLSKIPAAVRTLALCVQTRLQHAMAVRMARTPRAH